MASSTRLLTAEALWQMPAGGGHNELVDGELRPMTPAGYEHGRVTNRIAYLLTSHVIPRKLGDVLAAETGFVVARDPDTVLAPDVAFITRQRRSPTSKSFFEGAPDLAVEVASKWDRLEDLRDKARRYVTHGAAIVWVVDPSTRQVEVFTPEGVVVRTESDHLSGGLLLPEFSCSVSEFFAD